MNTIAQRQIAPAPIFEAVTGVVQVDDEVLLLRRQPSLRSFPGFNAFAGGRVEKDDGENLDPALAKYGLDPRRVAALARELREELAVDLADIVHRGELLELAEAGYALTPPQEPRRFSTFFYRIRLARKPALTVDTREHSNAGWDTPANWLARYADGHLLLVPPTLFTLQHLAEDPSTPRFTRLEEIGRHAEGLFEIAPLAGVNMIFVRSNTLPPAAHTNCFRIGDGGAGAPRLLIDPSPADDAELEALWAKVQGRFDCIFLTHHHPDHHERADVLARRAGVAMMTSADTHARIADKHRGFFEGVQTQTVDDGDTVTHWLGRAVRAMAVPGHDEGQLALMPQDRAWCIVGDLIQGVGTVVIAPPEGDMRKYFATLEKVIALDPAVIFPSHGIALGGTHYLQAALAHRRQRERQILDLHNAGGDEDRILGDVYAGTPPPLLPYARINIRSHLAKLREEGRVG